MLNYGICGDSVENDDLKNICEDYSVSKCLISNKATVMCSLFLVGNTWKTPTANPVSYILLKKTGKADQ